MEGVGTSPHGRPTGMILGPRSTCWQCPPQALGATGGLEDEGHKAETTTPLQLPLGRAWGSRGAPCAQPPRTHVPSAQQRGWAQAPPGATPSVQRGHPAVTGACRPLHPGHHHTCTARAPMGPQMGAGSERWLFWGLGSVHCPGGNLRVNPGHPGREGPVLWAGAWPVPYVEGQLWGHLPWLGGGWPCRTRTVCRAGRGRGPHGPGVPSVASGCSEHFWMWS